jgi:CDP-6-deoxy-D-xylo-4-hexulose-3-dehydrase
MTATAASYRWPLMAEGVSESDRFALADFLRQTDRLTMGRQVRAFEAAWSEWLGCRYSVMVNSGSSANLLLLAAMKQLRGTSDVVCQAVTWATNISPVVQCGFDLHLVDINLRNFGPDPNALDILLSGSRAPIVFLTHLLGFPAVTQQLLEICLRHGATILEDCCESHGARFDGRKVGTLGEGSTFSFYYGHHMTTIEGGMICTDREDLYRLLLLLRSHGLSRELPSPPCVPDVDPRFTFLLHGYNVRPTELNGFLGLRQLPRLDSAIERRNRNLRTWLSSLDPDFFHTGFDTEGVSSFSLPVLLSKKCRAVLGAVRAALDEKGVESRPVISGNVARHPFLRDYHPHGSLENADYVHDRGLYIGNYPSVTEDQVREIASVLNETVSA